MTAEALRFAVTEQDNLTQLIADFPAILDRVAKKTALFLEGLIIDKFTAGHDSSWPDLATSTIRQKGSTKAWVDTGNLKAAVTHLIEMDGQVRHIRVGIFDSDMGFIARCLEFGTKAHDIYPRNKKTLAWKYRKGSKRWIVARHVHHPRTPERPLFRLVLKVNEDHINDEIIRLLNEEIDRYRFH
ncbi:MAG: hypothetical protein LUQ71_10300 [Methanoregula sp.]|nr:hypothetical protein [Methanoregula sp.]